MITSPSNPRLKLVRRLASRRQRERLGLFVCEGEDVVAAALDAGIEPAEALVDAERPILLERLRGAELVAPDLLRELSALAHPARVVAVFRAADLPRGTDAPSGLALWHVRDPGNVGALVRSADAFGPAFVALSSGCGDPLGAKGVRAAAGALFRVPLSAFEEAPGPRVALVSRGGTPLAALDLPERVTFVVGAEREGLPREVVARCDWAATIALAPGAESLNAAMAGTIALYERARR